MNKNNSEEANQFARYEEVRKSGRTNMFDMKTVEALSGLTRKEIIFVQKNYKLLREKYS